MHESRPAIRRSLLHPLISVLLPFSFLQAIDAVIRLGVFNGLIPAPPPAFLLVVLAGGISETAVSNLLTGRRIAGALPRVRELLLTLAASAVLLTLSSGGPFHGDWNPLSPGVIWPLLLCGAQWLLTLHFQNSLRSRELYLSLLHGVAGNALVRAAREAGGEAADSQQSLRKLRTTAVVLEVFAVAPFVLLLAARAIAAEPAPAAIVTVRVLIHAVCGAACLVILHLFAHEQTITAAGVVPAAGRDLRRIGGSLAGIGGVFLAGLLLSGPPALMPLSLLARFFAWLSSIMPKGGAVVAKPPGLDDLAGGPRGSGAFDMKLPPVSESDLLVRIFRVVGIVIAAAAGIALLYFIIRPLLSRETRRSARQMRPLQSLLRRLKSIARFVVSLPGALSRWMRSPGKGFASIPGAILGTLREAGAGRKGRRHDVQDRAQKKAQDRAVRDFQRLTRWGRKAGVIFTGAEGPEEYMRRLETRAPDKGPALREAALLLEELVYADAPAARGERALARMVDGIIR